MIIVKKGCDHLIPMKLFKVILLEVFGVDAF